MAGPPGELGSFLPKDLLMPTMSMPYAHPSNNYPQRSGTRPTVEDQSQAWGICCHSCTWREGFAPSWKTESLSGNKAFIREDLRSYSWQGQERTYWIIG